MPKNPTFYCFFCERSRWVFTLFIAFSVYIRRHFHHLNLWTSFFFPCIDYSINELHCVAHARATNNVIDCLMCYYWTRFITSQRQTAAHRVYDLMRRSLLAECFVHVKTQHRARPQTWLHIKYTQDDRPFCAEAVHSITAVLLCCCGMDRPLLTHENAVFFLCL